MTGIGFTSQNSADAISDTESKSDRDRSRSPRRKASAASLTVRGSIFDRTDTQPAPPASSI